MRAGEIPSKKSADSGEDHPILANCSSRKRIVRTITTGRVHGSVREDRDSRRPCRYRPRAPRSGIGGMGRDRLGRSVRPPRSCTLSAERSARSCPAPAATSSEEGESVPCRCGRTSGGRGHFGLQAESLEVRQMLSATVSGTDTAGDHWTLTLARARGQLQVIKQNDSTGSPGGVGFGHRDQFDYRLRHRPSPPAEADRAPWSRPSGSDGRVFFQTR